MDLLAVQGTLKSLLQHHCLKVSILQLSAFFMVQLSHPYMTTGKTISLTIQTFVGKVIFLLFNMLFRLVIAFLPRSKHLLISWLQSPSAVTIHIDSKCLNRDGGWNHLFHVHLMFLFVLFGINEWMPEIHKKSFVTALWYFMRWQNFNFHENYFLFALSSNVLTRAI